jgi:hypothetical protein
MVMVPNLRAAHTAEKFLCPIGASAVERIGFFVVDTLHFKAAMQLVPVCGLVSVDEGARRDAAADEIERAFFTFENRRQRVAVALADYNHSLALAGLVFVEAAPNSERRRLSPKLP